MGSRSRNGLRATQWSSRVRTSGEIDVLIPRGYGWKACFSGVVPAFRQRISGVETGSIAAAEGTTGRHRLIMVRLAMPSGYWP